MRRALPALLVFVATAAAAQPVAEAPDRPAALAYRLPAALASGTAPAPPALRTAGVAFVSGTGAFVVGSSVFLIGAMTVTLGSWGSGSPDARVALDALSAVGSTLGAGLGVYFTAHVSESWAGRRGFSGFLDLERRDAWTALLGAAVAFPVAIGVAYVLRDVGPDRSLAYVSVPVVQGLGAAVAIDLRR